MASMSRFKMSQERLDAIKEELNYLETVREKEVAELIKEARSFGDLSENSEYDEAKTEQGKLYSKIAEIKDLIEHAEIMEKSEETGKVGIGSKVTVLAAGRIRKLVIFSIVCGIGIALCNQINMYLAGVMEAVIFYPVVNGGFMLLNILAGVLLWHEKLSRRQWFGLIMGGAAIFLLCGIL